MRGRAPSQTHSCATAKLETLTVVRPVDGVCAKIALPATVYPPTNEARCWAYSGSPERVAEPLASAASAGPGVAGGGAEVPVATSAVAPRASKVAPSAIVHGRRSTRVI